MGKASILEYESIVSEYFDYNDVEQNAYTLSDQVLNDLDFDLFFEKVDHTTSAIGQQYLYDQLRRIDKRENNEELQADLLHYQKDKISIDKSRKILEKLSKTEDYSFPFLMFGELPKRIGFIGLVRVLQFVSLFLLAASIFKPVLLLALAVVLIINMALHYWHKNKLGNFAAIFYRLNKLTDACRKLNNVKATKNVDQLNESLKSLEGMSKGILLLKTDALIKSEIASFLWVFLEFFKILTLAELITFHKVVEKIKSERAHIKELYCFIGRRDLAISIILLRNELPFYSEPLFHESEKKIKFKSLYHPLVKNCVSNDLELYDKSLLLTGSNMSGKSTFVKAINLNVISAQVLKTCFAESYEAPIFALSSSMKIKDNIKEDKSYYLEEVVSIGEMIEKSNDDQVQYLFSIDEVFKGTNTIERISAAKAILSYLNDHKKHLVLVSTHDIELTDYLQGAYELYYFQEQLAEEELSFDYKLHKGQLKEKNALKILEISGYPEKVIEEAKMIADGLEKKKV